MSRENVRSRNCYGVVLERQNDVWQQHFKVFKAFYSH